MKPKLLLGKKGSGKTTRLFETVKWLKALIVCPTQQHVRALKSIIHHEKGYLDLLIIPVSEYLRMYGTDWDIVCIDNYDECELRPESLQILSEAGKIQPVFTQTLDTERFDVEIL